MGKARNKLLRISYVLHQFLQNSAFKNSMLSLVKCFLIQIVYFGKQLIFSYMEIIASYLITCIFSPFPYGDQVCLCTTQYSWWEIIETHHWRKKKREREESRWAQCGRQGRKDKPDRFRDHYYQTSSEIITTITQDMEPWS